MASLSYTGTRRRVTARPRFPIIGNIACKAAFLLAIGFSATLVFGLIGH